MVFKRVSTGCDECRLQHTKCDGGIPSCGRCLRRKIVCPGYRHVGGFVFKPQTKYGSKPQGCLPQQKMTVHIPNHMSGFEFKHLDHFVAFFFGMYHYPGRRNDASCGLFDHASLIYHRASPDSSLPQAAALLGATTFVLSRRLDGRDFSWYHNIRHNAIKSMQHDLECRTNRLRDDTLMAVLLLDFTEAIVRSHMGGRLTISHQNGALALLKLRGTLNFKTEEARSLYNAARYATLRGSARSTETISTLQALDLLAESKRVDQPPVLRLLDVLDRVIELQHAVEAAISTSQSLSHLHASALEIQVSLDAWAQSLPTRWLPCPIAIQASVETTTVSLVERYESLDIALVYNLWRCACLKLMRLRQLFCYTMPSRLQPLADEVERTLKDVRRAVPVFLGLLQGSDYVEHDAQTGAWKEAQHHRAEYGAQRFPGDNLGKWFLAVLWERLEQTIGHHNDIIPQLHLSPEGLLFFHKQKRIVSELSLRTTQLERVFSDHVVLNQS